MAQSSVLAHLNTLKDLPADDGSLLSPDAYTSMLHLIVELYQQLPDPDVDVCRIEDGGLFFVYSIDGHRVNDQIDKHGIRYSRIEEINQLIEESNARQTKHWIHLFESK